MSESRRHLRMAQLGFILLLYCAWLLWPVCLLPGNLLSVPGLIKSDGLMFFLFFSAPMYLINSATAILSGLTAVRLILLFIRKKDHQYLRKTLMITFLAQLTPCINSLLYASRLPPLWTWPLRLLPLILFLLTKKENFKISWNKLPDGLQWPFIHEFRLYQQLAEDELAAEEAADANSTEK